MKVAARSEYKDFTDVTKSNCIQMFYLILVKIIMMEEVKECTCKRKNGTEQPLKRRSFHI